MGVAAMAMAAALVGAAVLVPAMSARRSAEEPAGEPPPDRLGNVPAWEDAEGNLHIGHDVLELDTGAGRGPNPFVGGVRFALTAGGVVWAEIEKRPHLYWQSLDGERVELTSQAWQLFATDPLGDLVVWVTKDDQMVTYDLGEERVVDSRPVSGLEQTVGSGLDQPGYGLESPVLFVDDDEIVYEAAGDLWTLDIQAGRVTQMLGVSAEDLLDQGPSGSVVAASRQRDGRSGARSLAQLEFRGPSGTVLAERDRLFREGRLSPDGRWFVTSTGYEAELRTVVLDTTTGKQVPLDLPDAMRGAYANPWGWSGADVLMLGLYEKKTSDGGFLESVWACRLADGTCEMLPDALPIYPW
jgi:hypothetical protein